MTLTTFASVLALLTPLSAPNAQLALFQTQKARCQSELNVDAFDDATLARNQTGVEALHALLAPIVAKPKLAKNEELEIFPMTCLPEMRLENLDGYMIRGKAQRIFLTHTSLLTSENIAGVRAGEDLWSVGSDAASERFVQLQEEPGRTVNLLLVAQDGPFPPNTVQVTKLKAPYFFTAWEAFEPRTPPQCKALFERSHTQSTLASQELKDCFAQYLSVADRTRALAQATALESRIDALFDSMSSK